MIREQTFREDLFFRISEIVIDVPPVRERSNDTLLLAQTFLQKFSEQHKRKFKGFTDQARAAMDAYQWPGNVRELENRVKRAVVLADGKKISVTDLGFDDNVENMETLDLRTAREKVEREMIQRALSIHQNNVTHAAAALGISRPSLYKLVKKLEMNEVGLD